MMNSEQSSQMTAEEFRRQFPYHFNADEATWKGKPLKPLLAFDREIHGYKTYTFLNIILLEDEEGRFYSTHDFGF